LHIMEHHQSQLSSDVVRFISTHVESMTDNSNSNSFRWLDKCQVVIIGVYVFLLLLPNLAETALSAASNRALFPVFDLFPNKVSIAEAPDIFSADIVLLVADSNAFFFFCYQILP